MATERAPEWQSQAAAVPRLRQAWRALAFQQWLIQANASLQIQAVLASRMRDYFDQVGKRVADRQALIQDQLEAYGNPSGSTQPSGSLQSTVSRIVDELTSKGTTVNAHAVKDALVKLGQPPPPLGVLQGLIADRLFSEK
jgi:hypothetical protein